MIFVDTLCRSHQQAGHYMDLNNRHIGKGVELIGWLVVLFYVVKYGHAVYDTLSDASVRAYAPLIMIEGVFFSGSGLFIVWLGRLVRKNAEKKKAPENVP